ncbi:MAG: hypothetical protein M0R17_07310 [Candidatus Omnitrophica bacterium]|jgi:hypothetical protein|nr:hypothetical protein [Candidatus Omnitrophota bacterium]
MSCNAFDLETKQCMIDGNMCKFSDGTFEHCSEYVPQNEEKMKLHELFGFPEELNDKYYFRMVRSYCSNKSVDVIIREEFHDVSPDCLARICAFTAFQNTLFEQRNNLESLKLVLNKMLKFDLIEYKNGEF